MSKFDVVICPGCGSRLSAGKHECCPDCGYEDNQSGRLLTVAEIIERSSYPAPGALRLNDVCPAFIEAIIEVASA